MGKLRTIKGHEIQYKFKYDKAIIKDRIKQLRTSRGLTQEQASELVGLTANSWAKMESHRSSLSVSLENLIHIVSVFDTEPNYLFTNENENTSIGENDPTDLMLATLIKGFSQKEKELALSLLMAVRTNREK